MQDNIRIYLFIAIKNIQFEAHKSSIQKRKNQMPYLLHSTRLKLMTVDILEIINKKKITK